MITLYGISNCDSCRKALKALGASGLPHRFHDLRRDGLEQSQAAEWLAAPVARHRDYDVLHGGQSALWVDASCGAMWAHRASGATHPEGRVAPPKAAIFCPPAALRAACGGRHHGAARALSGGQNLRGAKRHNLCVVPLGWEALVNRKSKSWRALDESTRSDLDQAKALELVMAQPTLIKRPLIDWGDTTLPTVGFAAPEAARLARIAVRAQATA